jgi:type I restriction enzyme M protein
MTKDLNSIFVKNIQRGITEGILELSSDESKITYHCSRTYTKSFKNPEEIVRAAYFVELVLDYDYPKEKIDIEVTIPKRTPKDRADIVVYKDSELKDPFIVVECKKDGITDSEFKQAIEQVFGNANGIRAKYASVVAGTTRTVFDVAGFKPGEREKNVKSDLPRKYGKAPKFKFVKNDPVWDIRIVSKSELIKTLEKAHDTVWQGGKLAPTTAFDEVSKLLFCKIKDERDTTIGKNYQFQIGTHEEPEDVFNRINSIYKKAKKADEEVFKEDIRLEPTIVYSVVEHLQSINFNKTDLDSKGFAFEKFMEEFFRGKMGQFFTPREIIRFCVKMMDIEYDDLILDPACGSGGFLLKSMISMKKHAESNYDKDEAWSRWHDFAKTKLYGIEINDQIARVCKMNMILHDDGHGNIISTDSLKKLDEITDGNSKFKKNHFDIILTNPPFGAKVKASENPYLEDYDLGGKRKTQKTEILFIERCIDFLRPDGKMAIVLPDGILTNSSQQYVRDYIMDKTEIMAIISLPQFTFAHFGAAVKSSLVFLRKKSENELLGNYPIYMGIANHIGYDATGREDPLNDLEDIIYPEYQKFLNNKLGYVGIEIEDD